MSKNFKITLFFIGSLLPLIDNNLFIEKTYIYLIINLILYLSCVLKKYNTLILLSPLNFIYLYCQISLIIGDYAFFNDLVKHANLTNDLLNNNHVNRRLVLALYQLLLFFLTFYFLLNLNVYDKIVQLKLNNQFNFNLNPKVNFKNKTLIPFFCIPFLFLSYYLNTPFYSGYISHYFVLYFVLSIIVIFRKKPYFVISVFIGILIMIFTFYGDRREIIYFLYVSMILYVLFFHEYKLNIFKSTILFFITILLILTTTILRVLYDPESGNMKNLNEFSELFINYFNIELFTYFIVVNFDIANFYIHGLNSINSVLNDFSLVSYGSTLLKGLLIFLPRSYFPFKPESMLTLYTSYVDPINRDLGNSYPINFIAELFWNFHIFSLLVIFFLGYLFHKITIKFLFNFKPQINKSLIFKLSFIGPFLSYIRGAGIEYIIYSAFIFFIIYFFHTLQDKVIKKFLLT